MNRYIVSLILALVFILPAEFCESAVDDTQYAHAFIGYGVGILSTVAVNSLFKPDDFWYYSLPMISVIGTAAIKELTDPLFDTDDFNATLLGGFLGILTVRFYF